MLPHTHHALARINVAIPRNVAFFEYNSGMAEPSRLPHTIPSFARYALGLSRTVCIRATVDRRAANKTLFAYICSRS